MNAPQGRPVKASQTEMTQIVMPGSTNALHTAFGGTVMSWMDVCAAISAQRHCGGPVVTASVDNIHFVTPIRLGDVVVLRAQVNMAFRSSMEVGVRVETEEIGTGQRKHALTAYLTFVALDRNDGPVQVPPALAEGPDEIRRQQDAMRRRQVRLEERARRAARG